jgi:hypothetical protein
MERERTDNRRPVTTTPPSSLSFPDATTEQLAYDVSFDFECDWQGAINFRPGSHGTYGYLLLWSGCGGLSLKPDITLVNPFSSGGQSTEVLTYDDDDGSVLKCVGVIDKFRFRGRKKTDPIRISAYVSRKSAADLHAKFSGAQLTRTKLKTDLEFAWYIISCEGAGEKWFEAAHIQSFQSALANIATDQGKNDPGGELKVNIARESPGIKGDGGDVDIRLYKFEFEVVPAPGETTELHFETGHGQKVVREWGGTD